MNIILTHFLGLYGEWSWAETILNMTPIWTTHNVYIGHRRSQNTVEDTKKIMALLDT